MENLPGRLGNLTPEQEEKLFELWSLILQICGVEHDDGALEAVVNDTPSPIQNRTPTTGSEKPKKKRLGLFKKKDKKDSDSSSEKTASSLKEDDPDDKYGHNKVFRETLAERTPASIRDSIWNMVKMDHPDQLVLRFLRARKWDVQKALAMLISTMKWRQDTKVDEDIMLNGEEYFLLQEQQGSDGKSKKFAKDFLDQMRMGKSFSHGIDKEGRPTTIVRARLHRAGEQSQESLERYTIYLIETNRLMLKAPVDTGTVVFDMTGFSMANMDYAPVKFMIQCFEANYPESLGFVLVHKAPWVFQGIWKIIRGWLDPVVASKVHFTNNLKDMSAFVPPNRVPKELDGEDPWEYHFVEPVMGENPKLKDTATRDRLIEERGALYEDYEQKTLQWIHEQDAEKRALLKADRNEVARTLREGYWNLDPYVRARSLYDRVGILNEGGALDYYSWNKTPPAPAPASANGVPTTTTSALAVVDTAADDVD
ncbi:CRAL/TRIO domain-containing protein [Xylariales sp. AK1849]|nr:CRAL/TRIO domain-containing protein [Xylariales sp. AK1849]